MIMLRLISKNLTGICGMDPFLSEQSQWRISVNMVLNSEFHKSLIVSLVSEWLLECQDESSRTELAMFSMTIRSLLGKQPCDV
jgi:hypothetical protein